MSSQGWDGDQQSTYGQTNDSHGAYPQLPTTNQYHQQFYDPSTGTIYYTAIPQQNPHFQYQVPVVGNAHHGMMPVQQPQCSGSSSSMYTSSLPMAHGHTSPTYSQSSASTQLGSGSSSAGSSRAPEYGHPPQVPRFAYRQRPTERLGGMGAQASVERTGGGGSNHDTPKPNRERKSKQRPSTGPDGLSVHTQRKMCPSPSAQPRLKVLQRKRGMTCSRG